MAKGSHDLGIFLDCPVKPVLQSCSFTHWCFAFRALVCGFSVQVHLHVCSLDSWLVGHVVWIRMVSKSCLATLFRQDCCQKSESFWICFKPVLNLKQKLTKTAVEALTEAPLTMQACHYSPMCKAQTYMTNISGWHRFGAVPTYANLC